MSAIVLIGPTEALDALRGQFAPERDVYAFSAHDVRAAVEFIATTRPAIVALEESFAASARGEALMGRIADDPALDACEVRVVPVFAAAADAPAADGGSVTVAPRSAGEPPPALDQRGTRRAERIRVVEGVTVTVDGNPAELVDLSAAGAQVLSRVVLRPNQRVRLLLPEGERVLRCLGSVVWASFEMPPGRPPRYRAGLRLSSGELDALPGFAERHRAGDSAGAD